jgi:arylmalonate decarboxylase
MTDYIAKLKPRFRYGTIHPRAHEDPKRNSSYQLYHVVPHDVIEISTGLGLEDYTVEKVEKAAKNYWSCVERLAAEKVDLIIFSGAPISATLGRARVVEMLRQTKEKTGIPADAPLEALIVALKHLGIAKLSVGSRWADKVNDSIIRYLADAGVQVVHMTKRNQWASEAFGMTIEEGLKTALEVAREAGSAAAGAGAEGVFIPGGAAMSLHTVPAVEDEFHKPAFTNMNVELWNDLIRPGIIPPVEGWGCLLANKQRP